MEERKEPIDGASPAPRPLFGNGRWVRVLEVLVWGVPAAFFVAGVLLSDRARIYRLEEAARWLRGERQRGELILLGDNIGRNHFEGTPNVASVRERVPPVLPSRVYTLLDPREPPLANPAGVALGELESTRPFGPYVISSYRPVKAHFMTWLARAQVRFVHKGGKVDECKGMRAFEFHCPLQGWLKVEPAQMKVAEQTFECIGAHPASEGALHLRFPAMPIGATLALRTALADSASPPAVHVEARIADSVVATFDHSAVPGWEAHDVPTGAHAGTTASVEIILTVPSGGRHHFCFSGGT